MQHNEYDIGAAFKAIEDELIKSMIRNMKNHRVEEAENEKQWEMWQAKQLESLERYKKKNRKKYKGQFESINDSIDKIIHQAYEEGGLEQEIEILEAIKKRHGDNLPNNIRRMKDRLTEKLPFGNQVGKDFFQTNDKRLDALVHATTSDMQTAETAMLRMADDQYRKIIFNAQTYAVSGAGTYEMAVDMATKNFLAAGINCIEYKGGRRVNIKSYAEMVVRTSSKRAQLYADGQVRKEIGISTVIAKKRLNACPLCLPFVNKVLIDDVWSGGKQSDGPYPLVSEALKAGFFHPNCKDHLSTYIPGVTEPPEGSFTEQEIENISIESKGEAQQQYVARQAEKFGRLAKYSLDEDNKKQYGQRAKEWQDIQFKTGGMGRSVDVTEEWIKGATPNSHEIVDLSEYTSNGITYKVDGKYVLLDYSDKEKRIAQLLESELGGEISMIPRVLDPPGISTPDYMFRGEAYDLKELSGTSKNLVYNVISKKKRQASNFVLDISQCPLDEDEIYKQIDDIYWSRHTSFVDKIILIKDDQIRKILSRKN